MTKERAVTILGALAQGLRLELWRVIATSGPEGMPAGEIAERFSMRPSSLSFHLQQLARAGLVTSRRRSRNVLYVASGEALDHLVGFLGDYCRCRVLADRPAPTRHAELAFLRGSPTANR